VVTPARIPGRGGRLPADLSRPHLRLTGRLDTAVPPNPAVADWLSKVPEWPMYGNDQWGDCVWAMAGHGLEAWSTYGEGSTVEVTLDVLLKGYHDVTGFDPHVPSTDQGTNIQDALEYWRKTGLGGHKILAFARVDHNDMAEVQAAINVFGALAVGVALPAVAEQQFADGQPWDVVTNDGGILGGHAIHAGAYDEHAGTFTVTTWGHTQVLTEAWWRTYVDELWVIVSPEWLSAAGVDPEGLDLAGLGEDFAALTHKPNPFPSPAPSPTPEPPAPTVDAADRALAAAVGPWVNERHSRDNKRAAAAVKTWMAVKGLS
jgi:hypothetical protein